MNNKKRSTFSGGFGFVLAAAGSAVGLGNILAFPLPRRKIRRRYILIILHTSCRNIRFFTHGLPKKRNRT